MTVAQTAINPGIGTPRFCTAGCAEDVYMSSVLETFFRPKVGDTLGAQPEDPILALGWEIASDLKTATFEIRKGVPFHKDRNGKDWGVMTVDDVVFSFNDANSVTTPDSIHGQAGDFAALFTNMDKVDDSHVRITYRVFDSRGLRHRFSLFWQTAGVLPKKAFDELGVEGMRDVVVGTGPYRVTEWVQNDKIVIEAVDNHWRKTPSVQKITMVRMGEAAARRAALETGQVAAANASLKDWKALLGKGLKRAEATGFVSTLNIGMAGNWWEDKHPLKGDALQREHDTSRPWIGDPTNADSMEKARKARLGLAHAIDREGIAKSVLDGFAVPAYFAYQPPPDHPKYKKGPYPDGWEYPFDIAKAKAFLKEAGADKGFDMEVWVGPPGTASEVMTAVAGTWLAELNIKVTMDQNVYSTYRPSLVQRTTKKPFTGCGDDEKWNFPFDWARGFVMSALSDGGYGVGMEIPFATENYLAVAGELDKQKRVEMNAAFVQKGIDQALCIGFVSNPSPQFIWNPSVIADWDILPMGNGNLNGMHNFETIVLK